MLQIVNTEAGKKVFFAKLKPDIHETELIKTFKNNRNVSQYNVQVHSSYLSVNDFGKKKRVPSSGVVSCMLRIVLCCQT